MLLYQQAAVINFLSKELMNIMATLKYSTYSLYGMLVIEFNAPFPQRYKDRLRTLGFTYNRKQHCWVGNNKYYNEAIAICKDACNWVNTVSTRQKETLCWTCANSVKGDFSPCSWARNLTPVKGWKATPVHDKTSFYTGNHRSPDDGPISYNITSCPFYEKDC